MSMIIRKDEGPHDLECRCESCGSPASIMVAVKAGDGETAPDEVFICWPVVEQVALDLEAEAQLRLMAIIMLAVRDRTWKAQ